MVHDLLDSGLNYLYGTAKARASVAIQHRVFAEPFSACLEKRVLFCVETNALVQSVSRRTPRVASGAAPFIAVSQSSGGAVVSVPYPASGGDKMGRVTLEMRGGEFWIATYPVPTTRLLRTRIAPTLRFIQFERRDAKEARC